MNKSAFNRMFVCAVLVSTLVVSGCQTYHPKPLPTAPDLLRTPTLTVPASQFNLPGLKPHPIPPNGLDETAVVTLAVLNNPDLKAARLAAGVAAAQLVEAGLLPDPVVSGGVAKSTRLTGYNVGLSEDIQALITRGAAKAAAKARARQVNLDILWQEWQVAEKARELFIQSRADDALQRVAAATRDLLAGRYQRDNMALEANAVTANTVSADLAALTDAETTVRQLQLEANQTRHNLNLLLGLEPTVQLHLIGQNENRLLSREQFQAAVAALPHRRADLLALQAGYQSQEQLLREAILAQFPSMSAGVEPGRDPAEGVKTVGLTVNVTLPLFNRNQGQIAIRRATRALLRQTYQARLDKAANESDQVWQAAHILERQLRNLQSRLLELSKTARAAEESFRQGNLDFSAYVSMQLNSQAEQAQAIRLRALLEQAKNVLKTMLGCPSTSE